MKNKIYMNGKEIYKYAVTDTVKNINKLLEHVILDMQLIAKEKNIEIDTKKIESYIYKINNWNKSIVL